MAQKKSSYAKLKETLFSQKENSWISVSKKNTDDIFKFSEEYKTFLEKSKTERLCVKEIVTILKKAGFKDASSLKKAKTGDKLFYMYKEKSIIAFKIGKHNEKLAIIGSHVDSPRLDLKPNPLYEKNDCALLKTHYYGGIKKYHWVNIPLHMIGVIFTKSGKKIELDIGSDKNDPVFVIADLLPHLSKNQLEKNASKVIEGEELNILFGNIPLGDDEIKEKVKFSILKTLYDTHGLIEDDFASAEIEFVPAFEVKDVGLDRSMIGGYGQDDRVCAYTSLKAIIDAKETDNTIVSFFTDKEEIGSVGNTGAASLIFQNFMHEYISLLSLKSTPHRIFSQSKAISADVTAAYDPTFCEVSDAQNSAFLGKGIAIEKYTGSGGKYLANDSHAEYVSFIRRLAEQHKIPWQVGEIGKVDQGGGGTIAMYLSYYGMDIIDIGVALLGMHSPFEISSKVDIYHAYKFYRAFYEST